MDIVCPARRHDAEAGERCHLVSCPRLPYGGEVLPALAAVCHYIERTFPYPELPHDSGRISILQSCRCAFLPGTAPQHARGRELPATKTRRKNPLLRLHPDSKASDTFAVLFESALDRAFRGLGGWKQDGDLRILLVPLAEHCFKAGIPEEEVVRQTLMHYYREADEFIVRQTIHNLYQELKGFGKRAV